MGMSWKLAREVVMRHDSADPFQTYSPRSKLVELQVFYERRDALAAVAGSAAARSKSSPGVPPHGSGSSRQTRSNPPASTRVVRPTTGPVRGRSRTRKVVLHQAICFIVNDLSEWFGVR